ncbi:MAG: DEAD/DEAH box helicase [Clostridia bacterium]|nr:DEAD/DEAH box helicase [Clostridia bacterium]
MLTLSNVKGVGKATEKKLEELGVNSVFGLFSFLPRKYIDLGKPISVLVAEPGALCLLEGRVEKVSEPSNGGKHSFSVSFSDNLADNKVYFVAKFYNMAFLHDGFEIGQNYRMLTRLSKDLSSFTVVNPHLEKVDKISKLEGIFTVYPLKNVFPQGTFKNLVYSAIDLVNEERRQGKLDVVNEDFVRAFSAIHKPTSIEEAENAFDRLAAIDLALALQIYKKSKKSSQKHRKVFYDLPNFRIDEFLNALDFEPTPTQMKAFSEIFDDMTGAEYMSRIVSGDVGSGKTVVAFFAVFVAALARVQSAIMAPTEILARQHAEKFARIAKKLGINHALLTSSTSSSERSEILEGLKDGKIDCVIGTQSLIGEEVQFKKLCLAIIDEQHKFGVNDRAKLESKGAKDVLSLTATPIPRSMSLTFYDDVKISHIEKRESAKTNVTTVLTYDLQEAVNRIVSGVKSGRQAFIVCPAIEDAEGFESYSIERFTKEFLKEICILNHSILHGKLSTEEKNQAINDFYEGKIGLLIATSVIEVGIDTKASDILIVNADRFGLASLHQLRGRVGRDGSPANCYLHSGKSTEQALKRLETMCRSNDGQYLAEVDFSMRGAGDFLGTKQSGASLTPIFGLKMNADVLYYAKRYSEEYLSGESLDYLLRLTRGSKQKIDEFLQALEQVTLKS